MTQRLMGLGVSAGQAVGPVARIAASPSLPETSQQVTDADTEAARAQDALNAVADELDRRAATATGAAHQVLDAQAMITRDPALIDSVVARVEAGRDAPHAVAEAFGEHRRALATLGGYFAERAADLDDLRDRTIASLLRLPMPGIPDPGHPFVLVGADLAPADTATLDPAQVVAIVTERGGPTGHTAILAKQLGIPAVTACAEASRLVDCQRVLVDGHSGEVITDPDEALVADALRREAELAGLRAASHGPGQTADGQSIPLLVNIGGTGEGSGPATDDYEGVGLLRTEFLFLDRATAPSREEQRDAYRRVFGLFSGRRVVVRTLDVGADKPLPYLARTDEPNPALGVRGHRLSQLHPELLEEQLSAIADAAADSDAEVWVMAPMVATAREAREFAAAARRHGLGRVGVMIEVPSAAISARAVLAEVDFASIGTNDLAQYTFAADRLAGELAELLDPWQPALLRLIEEVAVAGHELDCPVGVCGEAASDPLLALVLIGLGITSLSMAPSCVPDVRAAIGEQTIDRCRELASVALQEPTPREARAAVAEESRRSAVTS
jgi:phosphotransferase system enzyme I (PtsI)